MTRAASLRRSGFDVWPLARRALLWVAALALSWLVYNVTRDSLHIGSAIAATGWATLALGAVVYLAGHALRILRLAMLIGGWRVRIRDVAGFHLFTAAVSLAIPMKLGEVYRVAELSGIAGGFLRSVMVAWCERAFDIAAILLLLLITVTFVPGAAESVIGVAAFASFFIAATVVMFFLAPENLRRASIFVIRRYDSPRTVPVLGFLEATRRAILSAPELVRGKAASLAAITVVIWLCEVACFLIIMPNVGAAISGALKDLLSFLSATTKGETLAAGLAQASPILAYLAATQIPLVLLGLVAAFHYIPLRTRA